jgi:hypothetical protein
LKHSFKDAGMDPGTKGQLCSSKSRRYPKIIDACAYFRYQGRFGIQSLPPPFQ